MKAPSWTLALASALLLLAAGSARAADWGMFQLHSLSGVRGSWNIVNEGRTNSALIIEVGPDCKSLRIETGTDGHAGSGNCNLYVRFGAPPTASQYLKRSIRANHQEVIDIRNPPPGRYFIGLFAQSNYRTCLTLTTISRTTWLNGGFRLELLNLSNWERAIRGRRPLTLVSALHAAAQYHAQDMLTHRYLSHTGRTDATRTLAKRIAATGYAARSFRENIHGGNELRSVVRSWMNNPTNRSNLLNSAMREAGFGWAHSRSLDRFVAVFAVPR